MSAGPMGMVKSGSTGRCGPGQNFLYGIALMPLAAVIAIYALVIWFRVDTGYWPSPEHSSDGLPRAAILLAYVWFGLSAVSVVFAPLGLLFLVALFTERLAWGPVVVFVLSWAIWASSIWLDPGGVYVWLID